VYLITYPIIKLVVGGWLLNLKRDEQESPGPNAQAASSQQPPGNVQ
jgi:hypothetical protein